MKAMKVFCIPEHFHSILLKHSLDELPEINTKLMLNVASPSLAFRFSNIPNAGVGLAREEFIINNYIGIHPMALLRHKTLNDEVLSAHIKSSIRGFENEEQFFIQKLSFGIAKIAAAFYPNTVIVRFSDFKTNEYRNLTGGEHFEPAEENPDDRMAWRFKILFRILSRGIWSGM